MARNGGTTATRKTRRSRAETQARRELAACYRMFYRRGMDDLIYTHLSVRIPDQRDRYLFIGFGQLFDEVTASSLMTVDIEGKNVGRTPGEVNPSGWVVHRTVFEAVPEAESVMHLHTVPGVAVSTQKDGLLPINQFAVTHAGQIAYHDYDGPGLRPTEQKTLVRDLGDKRMMFLRNHGTLTWGPLHRRGVHADALPGAHLRNPDRRPGGRQAGAAVEANHRAHGGDRPGNR